ncbi:MAG: hypothetical protein AB7T31_03810 [Gemmatimonadales bacterium]
MRIVLHIVAFLGMLVGGVWFFQGIGVLPGSFMSGRAEWSVYGGLLILASLALRIRLSRRRKRHEGG